VTVEVQEAECVAVRGDPPLREQAPEGLGATDGGQTLQLAPQGLDLGRAV
jgi:hypothetical protein